MKINEAAEAAGLSRRAVKYYEEQGLVHAAKDKNGYRNYTEEDIRRLKEISAYRKLGIGIKDIGILLSGTNQELLEQIYEEKKKLHQEDENALEALHRFILDKNTDVFCRSVDYKSVADAMQEMFPGFFGYFFMQHFLPYLQINITTPEQEEAWKNIVSFWDNVNIRIPLFMRISSYLSYRMARPDMEQAVARMDAQLKQYTDLSEEDYERLREKTRKNVKLRNTFFIKYHPFFISQRRFMKRLQDCGYNDIFLPNLIKLSPAYKKYHDALMAVNDRIAGDLGLYYDSGYQLAMKKDNH